MKFQKVSDIEIISEHFQKQTQRIFFIFVNGMPKQCDSKIDVNPTEKQMGGDYKDPYSYQIQPHT